MAPETPHAAQSLTTADYLAAEAKLTAEEKAVLASQGDVVFDQRGKLVSQSDLSIESARVSATRRSVAPTVHSLRPSIGR